MSIEQLDIFGGSHKIASKKQKKIDSANSDDMTDEELLATNEVDETAAEFYKNSDMERFTKHIPVPNDPKLKMIPLWQPLPVITREEPWVWVIKQSVDYCRRCGYMVDTGDHYCHYCGQNLRNWDITKKFHNGEGYDLEYKNMIPAYSCESRFDPKLIMDNDIKQQDRMKPHPIIQVTMFTKTSRKEYRCECYRMINPKNHGNFCPGCGRGISNDIIHDQAWNDLHKYENGKLF